VQEVAVTPGELLADADLIHFTRGASEKDEEEAIRKAVDFSATARRKVTSREARWAKESERRIDAFEAWKLKARDAETVFSGLRKEDLPK
jgi:hypothetical protein